MSSRDLMDVESRVPAPESAVARLRRALAWAIAERREVAGVLSTTDLVRVERALGAGAPLPPEDYPALRLFAQISARIDAPVGVPRCDLVDALEAARELGSAGPAWPFVGAVEREAFGALGYAVAGAGIDREQQRHREAWEAHGARSKRFLAAAALGLPRREVAWVFGAGHAHDLPLAQLAELFGRVVLVDIDGAALTATLRALPEGARARCTAVEADLTGIAGAWRARTDEAIGAARDAREAGGRMSQLFAGYHVAEDRPWAPLGPEPDLVVSQMVLTQLHEPLERYAHHAFRVRFGAPLYEAYPGLRLANMLFAHRVQHDHLRWIRAHAAAAVVTSDVAEQLTRAAAGGGAEPSGDELPLLGAFHLAERVPRALQIVARDDWHWHRAAPHDAGPGSSMRVEALALRRP